MTGRQKFGIGVLLLVAFGVGSVLSTPSSDAPTTTPDAAVATTTTTTTPDTTTTTRAATTTTRAATTTAAPLDWALIWVAWQQMLATPDPDDALIVWAERRSNRHMTEQLVDELCFQLDEFDDRDTTMAALVLTALDVLKNEGGWTDGEIGSYLGAVSASAAVICPQHGDFIAQWLDELI